MAHTNRLSLSVLNQILIDQVIVSDALSRGPSVPHLDCWHIVICPWMVNISVVFVWAAPQDVSRCHPLTVSYPGTVLVTSQLPHYNVSITEQFAGIILTQISQLSRNMASKYKGFLNCHSHKNYEFCLFLEQSNNSSHKKYIGFAPPRLFWYYVCRIVALLIKDWSCHFIIVFHYCKINADTFAFDRGFLASVNLRQNAADVFVTKMCLQILYSPTLLTATTVSLSSELSIPSREIHNKHMAPGSAGTLHNLIWESQGD